MRAITKPTVVEAFKRIVDIAPVSGDIKTDESGYKYMEVETLCVHISDPVRDLDKLVDWSPLGKQAMDYYRDQLVYGKHIKKDDPNDEAEYTYYQRLREYEDVDQIKEIIDKLLDFKRSRRAVAVTWQPWIDLESRDPPCLDWLKFTIKDNQLCLSVVFRSHDLIKGWVANVYAIVHLMVFIAMALEIEVGYLEVMSFDPHVYMSDVDRVIMLKDRI